MYIDWTMLAPGAKGVSEDFATEKKTRMELMLKNAQITSQMEADKQLKMSLGVTPEESGAMFRSLGGEFGAVPGRQMPTEAFAQFASMQKAQSAAQAKAADRAARIASRPGLLGSVIMKMVPNSRPGDLDPETMYPTGVASFYMNAVKMGMGGQEIGLLTGPGRLTWTSATGSL